MHILCSGRVGFSDLLVSAVRFSPWREIKFSSPDYYTSAVRLTKPSKTQYCAAMMCGNSSCQVGIEGIVGGGDMSDAAVDDITFTPGLCPREVEGE